MRVTEQILAVTDYGCEEEEVVACFDGMEEARVETVRLINHMGLGRVTLCRVRIIVVEDVITSASGAYTCVHYNPVANTCKDAQHIECYRCSDYIKREE